MVAEGTKPLSTGIEKYKNNTAPQWWRDRGMRKLALGIFCGFCGQVQSGYDGALIAGLLANPLFFVALGMPSTEKLGVIVAGQSMGTLPGLIPAAIISDRFGRRVGMAIGYLILIAAALTLALAGPKGPWYIFGGRFMVGFGSGFTTLAGAPYAAEISHPRNRPECTALIQTCFYVGSILSAWVSFGTLNIEGDWSWRLPLILQVVVPVMVLSVLPFVPESPRWLAYHNRHEEAHQVLAKYHANGDMNDELVLWELSEIKRSLEVEKIAAKTTSYATFWKTKGNRWRLAIILLVGTSAQWVGNGIITFYVVSILDSVGITDPADQTAYNGGLQIWNWFSAIGGAVVCERFGRRKLWLTSCIGQFISYAVITLCSALYAHGHNNAGYPVLAFLYIYFFFYAIAFTPLLLAYPIEILPYTLRSKGVSILLFCTITATLLNTFINPPALEALGWKYYFVFLGVIAVVTILIYFYYPETQGHTLEEIAVIFDGPAAKTTSESSEDFAAPEERRDTMAVISEKHERTSHDGQ